MSALSSAIHASKPPLRDDDKERRPWCRCWGWDELLFQLQVLAPSTPALSRLSPEGCYEGYNMVSYHSMYVCVYISVWRESERVYGVCGKERERDWQREIDRESFCYWVSERDWVSECMGEYVSRDLNIALIPTLTQSHFIGYAWRLIDSYRHGQAHQSSPLPLPHPCSDQSKWRQCCCCYYCWCSSQWDVRTHRLL